MTSRKLVLDTLNFTNTTGTFPRNLWILPYAYGHHPAEVEKMRRDFPDDIVGSPSFFKEPMATVGDAYAMGTYIDEWGCEFESIHAGVIGEVKKPLVAEWSDLEKVREPLACFSIDKEKINDFCRSTDKFVLAGCNPRPFERIQFLRGSENVYMDFMEDPQNLKILLDRLHRHFLHEVELWSDTEVDAVRFMDDWGAQSSLLISPQTWRKWFKPLYQEYVALIHSKGKKVFMHSDGYILDIYPDLIEIGVDALNSQIFCMGLEKLRPFAGQITFWGEMDRQHLLPHATTAQIVQAVAQIKETLAVPGGGLIAQCEFGPGAKPENVYQFFASFA